MYYQQKYMEFISDCVIKDYNNALKALILTYVPIPFVCNW